MWVWTQAKGEMRSAEGVLFCTGYSGHGIGINNPTAQHIPKIGPIPQGAYQLGIPADHPHLGPQSIPVLALGPTQTFGRSGFYCHGDNSAGDHSASEGCIILPRWARDKLAVTTDRLLVVMP
jgi:hypothetical protein